MATAEVVAQLQPLELDQPLDRDLDRNLDRDYNHSTDIEYKSWRAQARDHFQKHKQLSAESQEAYARGDKALAKRLSDKSKRELELYRTFNNKAAEFVYIENNKDSAPDELDLHGLFVSEAEYVVKRRLAYELQVNHLSELKVITGKGLHSKSGVSKLKPAVEKLCDESGLPWRVDPQNEGVIIVQLITGDQHHPLPAHWQQETKIDGGYSNNLLGYKPQAQMNYYYHQQQQQHHQQPQLNGKQNDDIWAQLLKLVCICIQRNL